MKTAQGIADRWFEDFVKDPPLTNEFRDWLRDRITELRRADVDEIERLRDELAKVRADYQAYVDGVQTAEEKEVARMRTESQSLIEQGAMWEALALEREQEIERLRLELTVARNGLFAVRDLIAESRGVDGLHLNGDVIEWSDIRTGGYYEAWLLNYDIALEAAEAAGGSE